MKIVKNLANNMVTTIRPKRFLVRTGITLVLSFFALLGISIAFDMVYQALARHSFTYMAAGLVLGQVCLYKNDLGRIRSLLSKAVKDDPSFERQQGFTSKKNSYTEAGSVASMAEHIEAAFAEDSDETDEIFEDDKDVEF